jgi:hypothetical protein
MIGMGRVDIPNGACRCIGANRADGRRAGSARADGSGIDESLTMRRSSRVASRRSDSSADAVLCEPASDHQNAPITETPQLPK